MKPTELALVPEGGADRPRHPRRRQRRRRAALDPRRHDRAARPPSAELRPRQLQRLQHLLSAGRVGHVGRLVGLARRRHRRPRRRAERRRELAGRVELLPAARPRRGRARERSRRGRPSRAARCRRSSSTSRSRSCAASGSRATPKRACGEAYPQQTGLLVVEQVIPESPASSKLEPGDVLVEVDGKLIAEFVPLAAVLDGAVGREVDRRRRARRATARAPRHGRRPARDHARRVHRVRRRRVPQALVSAGAAFLPPRGRRLRRESRLRVRQGRDPARQHRDRHRPRVARQTSTISSACSSRCPTTRRCRCGS